MCVIEDHRGHAFDVLEKAVQEEKKNILSAVSRDHQGKGKLVWSRVEIIRENINGCGIVYRNR